MFIDIFYWQQQIITICALQSKSHSASCIDNVYDYYWIELNKNKMTKCQQTWLQFDVWKKFAQNNLNNLIDMLNEIKTFYK